jgi:hypothetical protein
MLVLIFFNGCATTRKMELTAVTSLDQKTDPYGAVVSEKIHRVSISPYKEILYIDENAIFNVIIENGGEEPLTIGNENISVIFEGHDKKRTVKKLELLSAREFMNDVEYEYRKSVIDDLIAFGRTKDYISAPSLDGGDNIVKYYVVFPSGFNPGHPSNYEKLKILRETLPDLILNQKTIIPRESITALISCRTAEIPRGVKGDFKINVSIDGEEHLFTFNRRR